MLQDKSVSGLPGSSGLLFSGGDVRVHTAHILCRTHRISLAGLFEKAAIRVWQSMKLRLVLECEGHGQWVLYWTSSSVPIKDEDVALMRTILAGRLPVILGALRGIGWCLEP